MFGPGAVGKSVRGTGRFYIHMRVRYTNVRMNSRDWWAGGDADHEGKQTTNSVTGESEGAGAGGRARKPWLMHSVVWSRPFHFIPLPLLNESIRNPPSTGAGGGGVFENRLVIRHRPKKYMHKHAPASERTLRIIVSANPPAAPAVHHRPEGLSGILYINTFL